MRIVKLVSSHSPGGRAHARSFQHPATAFVVIVLLSVQPIAATAHTSHLVPKSQMSQRRATAPDMFKDCTAGGLITGTLEKGVEEGINEAIKLLQTCVACKKFFGEGDPVYRLEQLRDTGAIIVSKKYHAGFKPFGLGAKIKKPKSMTSTMYAAIVDLEPAVELKQVKTPQVKTPQIKTPPKYNTPCIYVNPSGFLVVNADIKNPESAFFGLSLAEARGIAFLHELAHIFAVIPADGSHKDDKDESESDRSEANTLCVRDNCKIPCAENPVSCLTHLAARPSRRHHRPFKPKRHSSILHKIASQPSY